MNYLQPNWPAPSQVKAYTTLRQSWGKLMLPPTENRIIHPAFAAESSELVELLALPREPIWVQQTHSNIVIEAIPQNRAKVADGTFANTSNQVCAVLSADCLPILISHKNAQCVAAIHAGWRGLARGIIQQTVTVLNQPADELLVWLGPAIGPHSFEVGEEVFSEFLHLNTELAAAFKAISTKKWLANLYQIASILFHSQGISNIYGGEFCTYTQEELFYSYRRDGQKTGRMASVIWLDSVKN